MAKGKNLNPADALRKAMRKKELKKNKEQRQKNREFALVKKDTVDLEEEIAELEKVVNPRNVEKSRLTEAKAELARIMKKKEDYVEEHPEARNLVYRRRRDKPKDEAEGEGEAEAEGTEKKQSGKTKRNLFNKNGLPKHPERSIYYDPVLNPYGMPPPGMPYVERALLPGEVGSEAEEGKNEVDDDDDIPMPKGPPPDAARESDDDIPLPESPPPGEDDSSQPPLPPGQPPLPPGLPPPMSMPPFAPAFPPQMATPGVPIPPPPPPGVLTAGQISPLNAPPPPPPLPRAFTYSTGNLPPPPPGFFPRRSQASGAIQDPLSNIPHQTYQAHSASRRGGGPASSAPATSTLPVNANLPAKPVAPVQGNSSTSPSRVATSASATVSAEPELRDFKKESTAFIPAALKRKKAGGAGKVNAAPSVGGGGEASDTAGVHTETAARPDLLGSLKEKLGPAMVTKTEEGSDDAQPKKRKVEKSKDDYDKFLEEMGGVLNAPQ